jgi:hypothetical protein
MKMLRTISLTCALLTAGAFAQDYPDTIVPGTRIRVRTQQTIDARDSSAGRVYPGTVAEDIYASDGRLMIPRGAGVELIANRVSEHEMTLDLESLTVNGHRYMVSADAYEKGRRSGVGANGRTGKFVGGGAVFGTIIGAIAGGGKGAAIGVLAGGAAGAGAQTLTRGEHLYIPTETVIDFRLDQPLTLGRGKWERDNGVDHDGNHYHDDYYRHDGGR